MSRSAALLVVFLGCTPESPACRNGADCASGVCSAAGVCLMPASGGGAGGASGGASGGGAGSGGSSGGGSATGGGGGGSPGGGDAGIGPTCLPDHDGTLTRSELPLTAGLRATFQVASDVTFSSAPVSDGGAPTWDLTAALFGDHRVLAETLAPSGFWFANDFAGATYATRLSEGSDVLGVFEVKADGLYLRGVASPADSLTATKLTYSPPAKLLAFPLSAGTHWTTTSTVSGTFNGAAWVQYETYDSTADMRGDAVTPFARFDVQRVKTVLTRQVGITYTVTRSYQLVTECFGTVAVLTSQPNELQAEFSAQAEVRRLAP